METWPGGAQEKLGWLLNIGRSWRTVPKCLAVVRPVQALLWPQLCASLLLASPNSTLGIILFPPYRVSRCSVTMVMGP